MDSYLSNYFGDKLIGLLLFDFLLLIWSIYVHKLTAQCLINIYGVGKNTSYFLFSQKKKNTSHFQINKQTHTHQF